MTPILKNERSLTKKGGRGGTREGKGKKEEVAIVD